MAKATKTKAKGGKKATRAKGDERNATPALECPHVAILTRPHPTESSGKLATRLTEFKGHVETWKAAVRKAFADGVDLPKFPANRFFNPNSGLMSRSAYEALVDTYNESETPGSIRFFPRYNPVLVDAIHAMNAGSLRRGSTKTHSTPPKDWDEKRDGKWWHEWKDEEGKVQQEPSGWHFDPTMPRRCHAETAEKLIDDPDKNILIFGNHRYVVGTGTHDGAAAFIINQTSRGNYRAGDLARKRMSFAGNKLVRDVVFVIEDNPNNGGGFTVKGAWTDVDEMVYMPGQVLTAGNLYDSKGKMLTAKEIRALDGDTKGLKFKTLSEPIVGKVIPWSRLWEEIKVGDKKAITAMRERGGRSDEYEAGSVQAKSITNICVNGKRVDPSETFCFGLKGGQIHMPAYIVADGEGKVEEGHFGMGVVIGERANAARNVGVHEAKGGTKETEAAKPKAAKKDKPAKAAKKVESKKVESKKVESKKVESKKVESKKVESKKAESKKAESKKAESKKAESKKVESKKAESKEPKEVEPKAKPSDAAPPVESNTADDPEPVTAEEAEVVAAETGD